MEHIKTEYCPYLEKLNICTMSDVSQSRDILQSIANNCPHLRSLKIYLSHFSSAKADADLAAFAEKCPQLEEVSLDCGQLTDQSVKALALHCSRLKKLNLIECDLTTTSLVALSERGLPSEELDVFHIILFPSAEIAAQCSHALSRIRELSTYSLNHILDHFLHSIPYMTGLRELYQDSPEDDLLVSHLVLLLQGLCCASLERLTIRSGSCITPKQLGELVTGCCKLLVICIINPICITDAVLVELARSCLHLQKITLDSSEVTEECADTGNALQTATGD